MEAIVAVAPVNTMSVVTLLGLMGTAAAFNRATRAVITWATLAPVTVIGIIEFFAPGMLSRRPTPE